jgi:hypothetical protein
MYSVYCTVNYVQCILYSAQCTVLLQCTVHFTIDCTKQSTVHFIVYCTLNSVHCTVYNCTMYNIYIKNTYRYFY